MKTLAFWNFPALQFLQMLMSGTPVRVGFRREKLENPLADPRLGTNVILPCAKVALQGFSAAMHFSAKRTGDARTENDVL